MENMEEAKHAEVSKEEELKSKLLAEKIRVQQMQSCSAKREQEATLVKQELSLAHEQLLQAQRLKKEAEAQLLERRWHVDPMVIDDTVPLEQRVEEQRNRYQKLSTEFNLKCAQLEDLTKEKQALKDRVNEQDKRIDMLEDSKVVQSSQDAFTAHIAPIQKLWANFRGDDALTELQSTLKEREQEWADKFTLVSTEKDDISKKLRLSELAEKNARLNWKRAEEDKNRALEVTSGRKKNRARSGNGRIAV